MIRILLSLLLVAGFTGNNFAQEKPIVYGNNPAAGKFYDIRGIKLYCEIYGSGKPLLMIHGNGGSISAFSSTIPYFAKKYRVIAVDSRAQGKSKDSGEALTFEMMADDFAALLDALHVDSAYVIGWSDGGINALLLAMRHPEKVIKLASTGANLWPGADAFAGGTHFWEGEKKHYEEASQRTLKTEAEKNSWKLFLLDWQEPHISLEALKGIKCPSLIICGDHDLISVEHTALIYENIPHANLWVVPDSGHATLKEHRDEFNERVDAFFTNEFHVRK